jgi:hypothetical protein
MVSLVSDLFVYVPADKEDMAQLLALIKGALEAAVAAAVVPPWPSAAVAVSSAAKAVVQLRFMRCAALLQSLMGFRELLSQQVLFRLVLQGLVAQQLVPCLRSSLGDLGVAVSRAEMVVQSLPSAWFSGEAVSREAQSLVDSVAGICRTLQQQLEQGNSAAVNEYGKRAAALCAHLGLQDQAKTLLQQRIVAL